MKKKGNPFTIHFDGSASINAQSLLLHGKSFITTMLSSSPPYTSPFCSGCQECQECTVRRAEAISIGMMMMVVVVNTHEPETITIAPEGANVNNIVIFCR